MSPLCAPAPAAGKKKPLVLLGVLLAVLGAPEGGAGKIPLHDKSRAGGGSMNGAAEEGLYPAPAPRCPRPLSFDAVFVALETVTVEAVEPVTVAPTVEEKSSG